MRYRLTNQNNSRKVLNMSGEAWFSILELAEEYGWNPLGTFSASWWIDPGNLLPAPFEKQPADPAEEPLAWDGSYTARVDESRLVMLEDALNLADALHAAILEYEPEPLSRLTQRSLSWLGNHGFASHANPSLGTLITLMDFCRMGAFKLEIY